MAKFTLGLVDDYSFNLLGINTSLRGYRVAWNLNKALHINLSRNDVVEALTSSGEKAQFNLYTCHCESDGALFSLIENRSGSNLFLPELPRADFLLRIDDTPTLDWEAIVSDVRAVQGISAVFPIEVAHLKSKQNLLLTS